MPLDQAEATRLLNAMLAKATYSAPTAPIMIRLMTVNGSATANGTEVANAGGSAYAPQSYTAATPAAGTAGSITNSVAPVTFTNMPAVTGANFVNGVEEWDSASTPRRQCYGALSTPKQTNLGDSLQFAGSSLSTALS